MSFQGECLRIWKFSFSFVCWMPSRLLDQQTCLLSPGRNLRWLNLWLVCCFCFSTQPPQYFLCGLWWAHSSWPQDSHRSSRDWLAWNGSHMGSWWHLGHPVISLTWNTDRLLGFGFCATAVSCSWHMIIFKIAYPLLGLGLHPWYKEKDNRVQVREGGPG